MDLRRAAPKPQFRLSKFKIALYVLGIMVCMSLLALIPPITKNSISKLPLNKADKGVATALENNPSGQMGAQTAAVQTASSAGQGNSRSVQGPESGQNQTDDNQPAASPINNQVSNSSTPLINPPIVQPPCFVCDSPHMMCPMLGLPCGGCGLPTAYACLEE